METSKTEKNFLFALLAVILLLTLIILYPFLTVLIISAAIAVVISPVYLWIKKYVTKNRSSLASFITLALFLILLCVPLFFMGVVIFDQAQNAYQFISQSGSTSIFIHRLDTSINNIMPEGFTFDTYGKVSELTTFLSGNIGNFFTSTFNTFTMSFLSIFTMFFMLKDGEAWREGFIKLLPLSEKNSKEILSDLKKSINRIIKGSLFIAVMQGLLSAVGLWIFGVPNPAFWGVVAGIASFLPIFGTSLVSIPAILFLYFNGMQLQALGLLIWSATLVGMIDNVISPYVISRNTEVPSIFMLFAILGGIAVIGPLGIIIGPLVLSLLYNLVSIYRKEVKN